jgi:fumarate reductase subunit C
VASETKTKELIRPMSATWWLQKPAYTKFMIRDITSVFIAGYCVFLMVLMLRAGQSPDAFYSLFDALKSPLSVILHLIALVFAVYHSVTFFNLTPRVLVVFRGEEKVPESLIAGVHYLAWIVVSLVILIIALVA